MGHLYSYQWNSLFQDDLLRDATLTVGNLEDVHSGWNIAEVHWLDVVAKDLAAFSFKDASATHVEDNEFIVVAFSGANFNIELTIVRVRPEADVLETRNVDGYDHDVDGIADDSGVTTSIDHGHRDGVVAVGHIGMGR